MTTQVKRIAYLPFGVGLIGGAGSWATDEEEYAAQLSRAVRPLSCANTADCVDERPTVELGDGTRDVSQLEGRIVPQLPGGLGLAVTKAAVAADLAAIRDTANFKQAYEAMSNLLDRLGYEDGGHADCGASKGVEASVATEIDKASMLAVLPAVCADRSDMTALLDTNLRTKRRRLHDGYYGAWDNRWHEGYLAARYPRNFSILAVDHNDKLTHGHHAQAVLLVKRPGMGFAKNSFVRTTGRQAFADTLAFADDLTAGIAARLGGSLEERTRFRLELGADPLGVLNILVAEGMPVYADAAA